MNLKKSLTTPMPYKNTGLAPKRCGQAAGQITTTQKTNRKQAYIILTGNAETI